MNNTSPYPKGLYILAIVHILSAVGVILFWVDWFRSGMHLNAEPEFFRVFENTFPLPDGIMAILMCAFAVLLFRKSQYSLLFGHFSAGMLLCLSSLDTLYHLQHGNFSNWADPETPSRIFISVYTCLLGTLTLFYLTIKRSSLLSAPLTLLDKKSLPPALQLLVFLQIIYGVSTTLFWFWWHLQFLDIQREASTFYNAYFLADIVSVSLCLLAAATILEGPRFLVLPFGIAGMAGLFFSCMGFASFGYLNPELLGENRIIFWSLLGFYLFFSLWSTNIYWRFRAAFQ